MNAEIAAAGRARGTQHVVDALHDLALVERPAVALLQELGYEIVEGRITVNGEPAHTGQRISFGDRIAVDGKPVCVLGSPYNDLAEQDITNGAAILALPSMLRALLLLREVRPFNWNDGDDADLEAAWEAVGDALAMAGHPEPEPA